jgi:hypothetical protein
VTHRRSVSHRTGALPRDRGRNQCPDAVRRRRSLSPDADADLDPGKKDRRCRIHGKRTSPRTLAAGATHGGGVAPKRRAGHNPFKDSFRDGMGLNGQGAASCLPSAPYWLAWPPVPEIPSLAPVDVPRPGVHEWDSDEDGVTVLLHQRIVGQCPLRHSENCMRIACRGARPVTAPLCGKSAGTAQLRRSGSPRGQGGDTMAWRPRGEDRPGGHPMARRFCQVEDRQLEGAI